MPRLRSLGRRPAEEFTDGVSWIRLLIGHRLFSAGNRSCPILKFPAKSAPDPTTLSNHRARKNKTFGRVAYPHVFSGCERQHSSDNSVSWMWSSGEPNSHRALSSCRPWRAGQLAANPLMDIEGGSTSSAQALPETDTEQDPCSDERISHSRKFVNSPRSRTMWHTGNGKVVVLSTINKLGSSLQQRNIIRLKLHLLAPLRKHSRICFQNLKRELNKTFPNSKSAITNDCLQRRGSDGTEGRWPCLAFSCCCGLRHCLNDPWRQSWNESPNSPSLGPRCVEGGFF